MRFLVLTFLLATHTAMANTAANPAPPLTAASAPVPPVVGAHPCNNAPLKTDDLLGQWQVEWSSELPGEPSDARLVFGLNPEFAESLLGLMDLAGKRHEIAGDVEEELLTLEESSDGKRISANWSLRAVVGRCGKELSGTWVRASDGKQRPVILRRPSKW